VHGEGRQRVSQGRDVMSEDAPVNTGAAGWPDPDSAYFAVRRMQTKLHRWATEDPGRRFGDLFNLVYDPAFLVVAWERVSTNKGARTAGIDKATAAQVETGIGVEAFLGQLRDALKSGEFRPVEVRQVMIPKANGKLRKLGIPTIADRVVQASLKAVLEPIFEADFKPCSYGFRPNRRAHDAIAEIHYFTANTRNYHWVLECDIKACFDEISHTALMDRLRVRIKDKRICALVKAFLKSGVLTELGNREETLTGTPRRHSARFGVIDLRSADGLRFVAGCQVVAGRSGIQGWPRRVSRSAVSGLRPCLIAVETNPRMV
jgi:RNA-directed DNA polymerase